MHSARFLARCAFVPLAALANAAHADDADLAKKLSNPVAALISVPFQVNYDRGYGPEDNGHKWTMNVQPVVPVTLSPEWNVISRTIVPLVSQTGVAANSGNQAGLGDITQSLFFSPAKPSEWGGLIWGVGPALLVPSGTEPLLSARKWGAGPTAVVLKQAGPWTVGFLGNHIWSFAGSGANSVNSTFLQPFVSYTTPAAWTFSLNTESTYDWQARQWATPVNAAVAKLVKFGGQPVSLQAGLRYWAVSPGNGPRGWGARVAMTFLFPK